MNKMSWPTALTFSVIIVSTVFAYSKSITLNSNSNGVIVASGEQVWQLRDGQVRKCQEIEQYGSPRRTSCSQWSKN